MQQTTVIIHSLSSKGEADAERKQDYKVFFDILASTHASCSCFTCFTNVHTQFVSVCASASASQV